MAWLATGRGLSSAQLLSKVAHEIPEGHEVTIRDHHWGSWAVAEAAAGATDRPGWRRIGDWLVAGHPTVSPWGTPTPSVELDDVVTDLERFGGMAASMYAGPLAAISLHDGSWHCALNGLMAPGHQIDDHRVMTTSAPVRIAVPAAQPIDDHSPAFSWRRLADEVATHTPPHVRRCQLAEPRTQCLDVGGRDWAADIHWIDHHPLAVVVTPSNLVEVLRDPALLDTARSVVVPELAWRAERQGLVLYAPFLERVVMDQVGYGSGRTSSTTPTGARRPAGAAS